MKFVYDDGGRSKYFKADRVGDCVTRAICNATGKDYKEVYNRLRQLEKELKVGKREKQGSVRDGTRKKVLKYYIEKELGWIRYSANRSNGESMSLTEESLPNGILIVSISKHLTCVKDKVIYDTYNCSHKYRNEDGTYKDRTVYSYWMAPTDAQTEDIKKAEKNKQIALEMKSKMKLASKKVKDKYNKKIKELEKKMQQELKEIEKKYSTMLIDKLLEDEK